MAPPLSPAVLIVQRRARCSMGRCIKRNKAHTLQVSRRAHALTIEGIQQEGSGRPSRATKRSTVGTHRPFAGAQTASNRRNRRHQCDYYHMLIGVSIPIVGEDVTGLLVRSTNLSSPFDSRFHFVDSISHSFSHSFSFLSLFIILFIGTEFQSDCLFASQDASRPFLTGAFSLRFRLPRLAWQSSFDLVVCSRCTLVVTRRRIHSHTRSHTR